MRDTMQILENQIAAAIEGRVTVEVLFTDDSPTYIALYEQEGRHFIEPAFAKAAQMPGELYSELAAKIEDRRTFNTDPFTLDSGMGYDAFFDYFYNKIRGPVRQWRIRLDLSQREAAASLGVTLQTYQDLESGTTLATGKARKLDARTRLACAAIEHGIEPIN